MPDKRNCEGKATPTLHYTSDVDMGYLKGNARLLIVMFLDSETGSRAKLCWATSLLVGLFNDSVSTRAYTTSNVTVIHIV
jgi:hypothetical protein